MAISSTEPLQISSVAHNRGLEQTTTKDQPSIASLILELSHPHDLSPRTLCEKLPLSFQGKSVNKFNRVALIGRSGHQQASQTIARLIEYLRDAGLEVWIEDQLAEAGGFSNFGTVRWSTSVEKVDLAIVVGGDGSLLGASRALARFDTPVLGINRGSLGFLTDIRPSDALKR